MSDFTSADNPYNPAAREKRAALRLARGPYQPRNHRSLSMAERGLVAKQTGTRHIVVAGPEAILNENTGVMEGLPTAHGYTVKVPEPKPYPYHASENPSGTVVTFDVAEKENREWLEQEAKKRRIREAQETARFNARFGKRR